MNIMRKLRSGGGLTSMPSTGQQDDGNSNSAQHTALGLMHLKKLFSEYTHPAHQLSDKEKEEKLYNMLPLFCKVFGNASCADMTDKFRDIVSFCGHVSRLMVSEIRRRASNQSTETASRAIAKFLEIENSEESSNGWMLLSTLNLLASGNAQLIQVMTSVALPSTLVKCLYLFFDLPEMESDCDVREKDSEFTPKERRILLQKIFVQVLVKLCSHAAPAEELSRKDDLMLLFSAITSSCPSYNVLWRKSAAEVLMTISRHGLTQPVVAYIHSKGCMALCIENMQRGQDLTPLDIVEMFVTVFCFLKDSSEVSQTLLDDFKVAHGYSFLSDFLFNLEGGSEAQEVIRNVVLMIASLAMCGYNELRPSQASAGSLFQILGFTVPQPAGRGTSVRNIQAFQVLQSVFLKSNSPTLCCTILDAISSVYHADNANYFILENQNTLSQFAERIHLKTLEIQEKFFQLLEFIVFQLNFVPCKELISLSILLKSQNSISCSIICMKTLQNILKHNTIFKDVYREVGILEVFVTCLQRYGESLKEKQSAIDEGKEFVIPADSVTLGQLVLESLTLLLNSNVQNANVFRECGGARTVHGLIQYTDCRQQALGIEREIILTTGGEDSMGNLLGMMHSAPPSALQLKAHILKTILTCLRESHRTRTVFRRVGGFVYVMSVLVSMEGCLADPTPAEWQNVAPNQLLSLLHLVFNTITVAMRFEPANAKFFHQEICLTSLCDTLRLLGCFTSATKIDESDEVCVVLEEESTFHSLFSGNLLEPKFPEHIPQILCYVTLVYRLLYDVALDSYEKTSVSGNIPFKSPRHKPRQIENQKSADSPSASRRVNSLNLSAPPPDPIVVHSGVVIAMLHLLPSIIHSNCPKLSLSLQLFAAEIIRSLVRSERNQQVMCEINMPSYLLSVGQMALEDEAHYLHIPFQYMLERLATQMLEPKDLRDFLRLGDPLCCVPMDYLDSIITLGRRRPGGPVPLTRIKTLVSMTTPRDFRTNTYAGSLTLPSLVEMDMSAEGFACLFLPSIAPQSPSGGQSVVNAAILTNQDTNVLGGIGSGDRIFPPQTGLSFSTWICVDRFSDPRTDPHCIRLLTIVRNPQNTKDDHLICLAVVLSARDKALLVSTQETPVSHTSSGWEPDGIGDSFARVWCPDLNWEGQWHHLCFVLNRAVLKNSSLSIYVNGQLIHTQKLHYISQNPGGGVVNMTVPTSVYAYIGTPPMYRRYSELCWKQGPCHLVEEVLSPHIVTIIYELGPHYLGSLQAADLQNSEVLAPLVAEEKIIFGLNAKAVSHLTLAKIRKVYSRVDNKSIAKQLGMSSNENATPIKVLHNSAGHLNGPARSLGGVVVGYLGVRVFYPRPVAKMIDSVGGCSVLLGLIAMAQDVESLYAGVKALTCVVRCNRAAQLEMDRRRSYQTLAMLLRKKKHLLNSHILHLTFSLVGTVDSGRESSSIPNPVAFQDLLCDIDVWHEAPGELERSLFEHLLELASESSDKRNNLAIMRELNLVQRLLHILGEVIYPPSKQVLISLLGALLSVQPVPNDLLAFGQFIASSLSPSASTNEKIYVLKETPSVRKQSCIEVCLEIENLSLATSMDEQMDEKEVANCILLRNRCLQLLHSLLFTPKSTVNVSFCEEVSKVLGFDWILLFLQGHVHPTSMVWGLRILVVLCSVQNLLNKFREGSSNGHWLTNAELVAQNKMGVVLGYHLGTTAPKSRDYRADALNVPGFQHLAWLLPLHIDVPEVYFLLMALMMGQPVKLLPADPKLDLDNVWSFIYGVPVKQSVSTISGQVTLCLEAVVVLLGMVRTMLNQENSNPESLPLWLKDYPVTIIQFLFFLYHNLADFMPIFMTPEVLSALGATLFPPPSTSLATTPEEDKQAESGIFTSVSTVKESSELSSHPAHKFVMDFLRVIVVDSLSLPTTAKTTPTLDLVLDASPEAASNSQISKYQTEVLSMLMEHLLAADVLIGEQAALPIVPGGNHQHIPQNVCYLTARIVDKIWLGMLLKDPHEVFDFIIKLITQAKRRPISLALEALYHSLNRIILYLLSRGTDTIADQTSVMKTLHKLTTHRSLVFGAGNHELDFIGCLTYCLLQLSADMKIVLDSNSKTLWHINPHQITEKDEVVKKDQNLMAVPACRVWEELYICKKPAIEEVFKISLPTSPNNKSPDLAIVREQVYEPALKLWLNYIDMEKKASYRMPWELHNQIQSKIQKVTGGLTRLASRTKVKRDETVKIRYSHLTQADMSSWTLSRIALIRDLVALKAIQRSQNQLYMQKYVLEEWLQIEVELTRERGLWGPEIPSRLDKWMLDITEGPSRMRKKMMKNDLFYIHYPYRAELDGGDNKSIKYKVASSYDSKEYYQKYRPQSLIDLEKELYDFPQEKEVVSTVAGNGSESLSDQSSFESNFQGLRRMVKRSTSELDDTGEEIDTETAGTEDTEPPADNQTILRLLEEQEKISFMFRCARIQGLDTVEGLLLFGKEHLYIVDGFTLYKSREVRDIDSIPPDAHDPILPSPGSPRRSRTKRQCSKFSYEDIREVHKRRYLLQPMALEVFAGDGRNYLLAFPRKVRNKVYHKFMAFATAINDSASQSVAGQKRTANVEQGAGILSSLIGETSVTQRWVRGEISNFQYLMHLNTLAGRSYNDLMQYPVFPWILADYDCEELDLTSPSTFRDFSKPMGAQSPERLEQFKKRFKEWDDPHGETPPYHYGTHYSSAMIVCSYLVRMEPFTQHFLRLQGGHFDLADRMFNSIREAWFSASKHNMADVKELIPEFFYLPEFLVNSNNFDLGCKQNGVQLGDVVLPPWAKDDPREFIRMHRAALECDYVSQHLHEWIDLIFGCKQQGASAVEATNIFHHLFYEGNVDIYSIDDPLKKNATIGFINNFGQIPKQLFKKAHPAKKSNQRLSMLDPVPIVSGITSVLQDSGKLFFHNLDNLKPSLQPIKELKGPVGQILQADNKSVLAVEQNKVLVPPAFNKTVAWGFADHSLRISNYDTDKATFVSESIIQSGGEIVACVCPSGKLIVTADTNSVVTIWEFNRKHLSVIQCLYGHTHAVTCLASSPAYNVIVSGSRDATAIVWDLSRRIFVRQLRGHSAPVAAVAVNDLTGDIATCAGTWLHLWTINGDPLASVNTCVGRADRMQQILCVTFSQAKDWDSQNVVMTGSTDGVVRMWSIDYVQVPRDEPRDSMTGETQESGNESSSEVAETSKTTEAISSSKTVDEKEGRKKRVCDQLVKQMSLSTEYSVDSSKGTLMKSGSESSLSGNESEMKNASGNIDTVDSEIASDNKKTESSIGVQKKEPDVQKEEKEECSGDENKPAVPVVRRRKSSARNNPQFRKSECGPLRKDSIDDSLGNESSGSESLFSIRPSKSDTSLSDSFVVVNAEGELKSASEETDSLNLSPLTKSQTMLSPFKKNRSQHALREGFKWQRQLVFRSKLTMHTAYDRKDNTEPASITALAVSKDHRTVYVGDARGRVFSWSVTDQPGRGVADHWLRDDGAECCSGCGVRFSLYERRHHCRNCGQLFCSKCSRYESEISRLRILKPVRVCQSCHLSLKLQQKSQSIESS
nr:PREDICTED: WD repeat and FYVE domain-containing protein 3 [Bemisia tabaci]